jgi:hypothetical protein
MGSSMMKNYQSLFPEISKEGLLILALTSSDQGLRQIIAGDKSMYFWQRIMFLRDEVKQWGIL